MNKEIEKVPKHYYDLEFLYDVYSQHKPLSIFIQDNGEILKFPIQGTIIRYDKDSITLHITKGLEFGWTNEFVSLMQPGKDVNISAENIAILIADTKNQIGY